MALDILKLFKSLLFGCKQNKYKHAFTLSETLITLGVVGVVAAITLPSLVTDCQKLISRVRIQKAYTMLSQTTYFAEAEYGPVNTWDYADGITPRDGWDVAQDFAETYIVPYLRVASKCERNSTNPACNYTMYGLNGVAHGDGQIDPPGKTYGFYLVDGTFVKVWAMNDRSSNVTAQKHLRQVTIFYDIDGVKGQNKMGHDIFKLEYIIASTKKDVEWYGKMFPAYINKVNRNDLLSNKSEMCNKNHDGSACLALIMRDGWVISHDYPW